MPVCRSIAFVQRTDLEVVAFTVPTAYELYMIHKRIDDENELRGNLVRAFVHRVADQVTAFTQ